MYGPRYGSRLGLESESYWIVTVSDDYAISSDRYPVLDPVQDPVELSGLRPGPRFGPGSSLGTGHGFEQGFFPAQPSVFPGG